MANGYSWRCSIGAKEFQRTDFATGNQLSVTVGQWMAELALIVTTMNEVGDAWAGRQPNMVEEDCAAHETP